MTATGLALWTQFRGTWCDNCRTAYSYMPADGNCPQCGPIKLRRATITVDLDDVDEVLADPRYEQESTR